jgi:hypothetical protein
LHLAAVRSKLISLAVDRWCDPVTPTMSASPDI